MRYSAILMAVSSAYEKVMLSLRVLIISLEYIMNRIGPSLEPWGTPYSDWCSLLVQLWILTLNLLQFKYCLNHFKHWPLIPFLSSMHSSFGCDNVSKALLKSTNITRHCFCSDRLWFITFCEIPQKLIDVFSFLESVLVFVYYVVFSYESIQHPHNYFF